MMSRFLNPAHTHALYETADNRMHLTSFDEYGQVAATRPLPLIHHNGSRQHIHMFIFRDQLYAAHIHETNLRIHVYQYGTFNLTQLNFNVTVNGHVITEYPHESSTRNTLYERYRVGRMLQPDSRNRLIFQIDNMLNDNSTLLIIVYLDTMSIRPIRWDRTLHYTNRLHIQGESNIGYNTASELRPTYYDPTFDAHYIIEYDSIHVDENAINTTKTSVCGLFLIKLKLNFHDYAKKDGDLTALQAANRFVTDTRVVVGGNNLFVTNTKIGCFVVFNIPTHALVKSFAVEPPKTDLVLPTIASINEHLFIVGRYVLYDSSEGRKAIYVITYFNIVNWQRNDVYVLDYIKFSREIVTFIDIFVV